MMTTKDATAPMDPGARENTNPTMATNQQRPAYAIKTLLAEVLALFPETEYEVDDYDGRNVAHAVSFLTDDQPGLSDLLFLTEADHRVSYVTSNGAWVRVEFHHNARTQDNRDSFGLSDAWDVLAETYDTDEDIFDGGGAWSDPSDAVDGGAAMYEEESA